VHPQRRLQDMRLRLDDYSMRLASTVVDVMARKRERVAYDHHMLINLSPLKMTTMMKQHVLQQQHDLNRCMSRKIQDGRAVAFKNESMLAALNPMAILQRGYSITRTLPGQSIVRNARQIKIDQPLEILLGRGTLHVTVKEKTSGMG
jgi:exodeoxyribonuclease VII large subunit